VSDYVSVCLSAFRLIGLISYHCFILCGFPLLNASGSDSSVVSECYIGIDRSTVLGSGRGDGRCLSSGGTMLLEVEYIRELVSKGERGSLVKCEK
jgi:hypothetical protein